MLLEEGVCYDQCVLLVKLYQPLQCFIVYSKAKFACYSRSILTSYFCGVLVLEDIVGLHRTFKLLHLLLLQHYWLGHRLGLL